MRNNEEMNTMTKESRIPELFPGERTFAWDTIVTFTEDGRTFCNEDRARMTEVKWCPATKMYWEV